jgi:hypothetical protein
MVSLGWEDLGVLGVLTRFWDFRFGSDFLNSPLRLAKRKSSRADRHGLIIYGTAGSRCPFKTPAPGTNCDGVF